MTGAIEVRGLTKRFGERTALDDVTFSVEPGERFGLLGPNGGGKTTLFRILTTLLVPDGGHARVAGFDPVGEAQEVRRRIGVVFQSPALDPKLTVTENLRHHAHLYGLTGDGRIEPMLERFGLADRARDRVETLSGGLRRRVEVAKGMLTDPEVLLMDEPSTGLDPGVRQDLLATLDDLRERGVTTLLTTHLMEEAERCDRVAILHAGRVVAVGEPEALRAEIGEDVITVVARDPADLCAKIRKQFDAEPAVFGRTVRLERATGHEFVPRLVEAFPGEIEAVTVGKPTLEDVYMRRTGHRFWANGAEP